MTWRLVHRSTNQEVKIGDEVIVDQTGLKAVVTNYRKPLMYVDWPVIDLDVEGVGHTVVSPKMVDCEWHFVYG